MAQRGSLNAPDRLRFDFSHAKAMSAAELSAVELDRLLDPAHYLGQAQTWVSRAVAEHFAFSA